MATNQHATLTLQQTLPFVWDYLLVSGPVGQPDSDGFCTLDFNRRQNVPEEAWASMLGLANLVDQATHLNKFWDILANK